MIDDIIEETEKIRRHEKVRELGDCKIYLLILIAMKLEEIKEAIENLADEISLLREEEE